MKSKSRLRVSLVLALMALVLAAGCGQQQHPDAADRYYNQALNPDLTDDQQIELLNKALAIDGRFAEAYDWRGITYKSKGLKLRESGRKEEANVYLEKAVSDFIKAIQFQTDEVQIAEYRMHCADTLMYLGRYDEARCLYLRNIEAKPNEELVEESRIGYDYAGKLERGEAVRPRQN